MSLKNLYAWNAEIQNNKSTGCNIAVNIHEATGCNVVAKSTGRGPRIMPTNYSIAVSKSSFRVPSKKSVGCMVGKSTGGTSCQLDKRTISRNILTKSTGRGVSCQAVKRPVGCGMVTKTASCMPAK